MHLTDYIMNYFNDLVYSEVFEVLLSNRVYNFQLFQSKQKQTIVKGVKILEYSYRKGFFFWVGDEQF